MKSFLISLTLLSAVACNSVENSSVKNEETKPALGLNDLAILMPIHTHNDLLNVLPRLSDKRNETEGYVYDWTQAERNSRLGYVFAPRTSIPEDQLKDFVLTSIRIDPCTNQLQNKDGDEGCVRELRLVWQRMDKDADGKVKAGDSNIHTLYSLDRAEFKGLLEGMTKLSAENKHDGDLKEKNTITDQEETKVVYTDRMLVPHPIIEKQKSSSPYLQGVLSLVQTYAAPENLSEIASFIAENTVVWRMSHLFVKEGHAIDAPIVNQIAFDKKPLFLETITKDTNSTNDFGFIAPKQEFLIPYMPILGGRGGMISEERQHSVVKGKLLNMYAIENPSMHNPKNTNCASCHVSGSNVRYHAWAIEHLDKEFPALDSFQKYKFSNDTLKNIYTDRVEVKNLTHNDSIQIFSFAGQSGGLVPVIAQRAINDTADSLEYLKKMKD